MPTLRKALSGLPDGVFADLHESEDAYLLVLDLPGVTAETVDCRVEDGGIRIEARRRKDVPDGFRYETEDRPVFLDVDLPLPPDATADGADATVERGVLELRLPKRSATSQDIPIE